MVSDWADDKARELFAYELTRDYIEPDAALVASLAVLLREVAFKWEQIADVRREGTLRDVRRMVDQSYSDLEITFQQANMILSRLEKL